MYSKVRELEAAMFPEDEIIEELTILAHESGFLLSNMISNDDHKERSLLDIVKEDFYTYEPRSSAPKENDYQNIRHRRAQHKSVMMKEPEYRPWENQEGAHDFVKGLSE